jgi:hypothetical protein
MLSPTGRQVSVRLFSLGTSGRFLPCNPGGGITGGEGILRRFFNGVVERRQGLRAGGVLRRGCLLWCWLGHGMDNFTPIQTRGGGVKCMASRVNSLAPKTITIARARDSYRDEYIGDSRVRFVIFMVRFLQPRSATSPGLNTRPLRVHNTDRGPAYDDETLTSIRGATG